MFKLGLILTCLALGCLVPEANSAYLSVDSFFNTGGNLVIITWTQGIENLNTLTQALNSNAMMLEGDVSWGEHNITTFNQTTLIMGTNVSSDLSLLQFLNLVQSHNAIAGNQTRKGVQLNFRSFSVLEAAVIPLLVTIPRLDYPVWLYTEGLPGPGGLIPPIGARDFLDLVIGFRNSTISLAWTMTAVPTGLSNLNVDAMVNALDDNNVDQFVTFPVRADIAAMSVLQLQSLAQRVPDSTLTIFGDASHFNNATFNNIRNIIINVGVNRTVLVVPDNIRLSLINSLPNSAGITSLSITCFLVALIANLT